MNAYDPKKLSTFITYVDLNSLYGWPMSEYLPYGGFKWLKNVDELDGMSNGAKRLIEQFLEVDFKYPDKLHESHNDYPLAPKKLVVSSDMLSKYSKKIADNHEIKVADGKTLIPNLDLKN